MKKNFTLLFCLVAILFTTSAFAQNKVGKVTGTAKSAESKPLEGATITLLKSKDSSLAKVAVSNKAGEFEIEKIAEGQYLLKVTAVGYTPHYTSTFEISAANPAIDLGETKLQVASKDLGSVQVTARRQLVEFKIDKTIVNVEASATNVGSTALEVLEKSPGISVDKDGNISLKGKQGVIILMDGKPTYLAGEDLANLLKNTPALQIDQIEIMSQPSAKFDASGNSGVINIKTKRSKTAGFNGSVTLGYTQGYYPKSSNSLNLNYRKNKVNLFANYSYSYFKGFNDIKINRRFSENITKKYKGENNQVTDLQFEGQPHNLKLGADYFVSKKTTLGVVVSGFYNVRKNSGQSLATLVDEFGQVSSYNRALSSNRDPWKNLSANFNVRHVFDSTGRELTADVDYVVYSTRSIQNSDNDSLSPSFVSLGNPFLLYGNLPSDIKIHSAKIDYSHPLSKDSKIEAGVKTSYVKTDNNAQFSLFDFDDNRLEDDTTRSNHFLYDELISAAYVNYNKQIKKWGFQLGLRVENTHSNGEQKRKNERFTKDYTQLFPTSYISYALNTNNNFGLSYGKRIERPSYQDMNPFQYFLDKYTYREGNPFLTPQFSHNVELSHNYKGQLNTSVNFTRTSDIINDVLIQNNETRVTFQTKRNIAVRRNIGLSVSYNKPINKIWTISFFGNAFNNSFEGLVNNVPLKAEFTSFMMNATNQFKFNKGWGAEISGWYRSKTLETGMIIAEPMGMFSLGATKQVLKNKGTVRLNIRDPFFLQQFRGIIKFDNIDANIRSRSDNRQVGVSFTYRFGKSNGNTQRRRNSASQDEQNRVGQGN